MSDHSQTPQIAGSFDPVAVFLELKFRKKGSLVTLKKADNGVPVYFIHEISGDVSCYHKIVEAIEAPVFGIQVPQPERNGNTISTIESLAVKYADIIIGNQPNGPLHIIGWSAGTTTALEVANKLTSIGRQPQLLINIDQPLDNAKGIVSPAHSFLENLYYWLRNEPKWPLSKFSRRLVSKVTEIAWTLIARSSLNPAAQTHRAQNLIDGASTREMGDFIRTFYDLVMAYIPPRSYSGQVLSIVASENEYPDRLIKSWQSVAPNSRFVFASGDHLTLVQGAGAIEVREHIVRAFGRSAEHLNTP